MPVSERIFRRCGSWRSAFASMQSITLAPSAIHVTNCLGMSSLLARPSGTQAKNNIGKNYLTTSY
eukprot:scaffold139800_cov24-Attheya_sp.AAC.1